MDILRLQLFAGDDRHRAADLREGLATRQVAFGHGALLYDEVVRVPWIVSWPGVIGPGVVRTPVSLVDLAATVMDLVEPGAGFDTEGRSLAVSMLSGREPALAPIFVERRLFSTHPLAYLRDVETALVEYPWKLIVNEGRNAPELYRLDRDSRERYDLADLEHGRARAMVARLEKWKRDRPLGPMAHGPGRRRAAEREALHALGYID